MALPCYVQVEDQGLMDDDDGTAAWRKIEIHLLVAGLRLRGRMLSDAYSGKRTLRIVQDDIGLDRPLARTLLLEAYDFSSVTMRECPSDTGEAFFDLEMFIRSIFDRPQARQVIRLIEAA